MRQPTVDELFDKLENKKSDNEIKEIVENESINESVNILDNKEIMTDSNGIVEVKYGNEVYRIWKVEFIRPLIKMFLKKEYPDSVIVRELNKIDLTIFDNKSDEIIPVEIQKTPMRKTFHHSTFEDSIRRQLENNIRKYGKCWFFMDSEYIRYLQYGDIKSTNISINMTWFIELMKENKLKAFTIKYDGIVKELMIKDFDFLIEENDVTILNENKLKIYINVIRGYKYTQEEIEKFYSEIKLEKNQEYSARFIVSKNKRCKLYGHILQSISSLSMINDCLDMKNYYIEKSKSITINTGIFEIVGTYGTGNLVRFIDKFNICKYFPCYLRNKEQWDGYKGNNLTHSTFTMISNGSLKQHKTMMDY